MLNVEKKIIKKVTKFKVKDLLLFNVLKINNP